MKRVKERIRQAERKLGQPLPELRRDLNATVRGGGKRLDQVTKRLESMLFNSKDEWEPTFCEADYTSGDGFQTSVWGPCTWVMLHLYSLNYTPSRKRGYKLLVDGLKETLPCAHCRNNFDKNWAAAIRAMRKRGVRDSWSSRANFSRLIWELHHSVNVMLGKDLTHEPSYQKMRDDYETFRSRCLTTEEIAAAQKKTKESGCVDSPYFNKYGAPSKARTHIWFGPRDDTVLKSVSGIHIDPKCRVCKF